MSRIILVEHRWENSYIVVLHNFIRLKSYVSENFDDF